MKIGLSVLFMMLSFAELKAKPFIQRAVANPSKPGSVLSYFFAVDYDDTAKYKDTMLNSSNCQSLSPERMPWWIVYSILNATDIFLPRHSARLAPWLAINSVWAKGRIFFFFLGRFGMVWVDLKTIHKASSR